MASEKHRKTRGFDEFIALKQRVRKGHCAETIVKTSLFASRIDFPSRVLIIPGPAGASDLAETRVLARWPQENIVKRVVL